MALSYVQSEVYLQACISDMQPQHILFQAIYVGTQLCSRAFEVANFFQWHTYKERTVHTL